MDNPLHDRLLTILGPNDPTFIRDVIYCMGRLVQDLNSLPDDVLRPLALHAQAKALVIMTIRDRQNDP